MNKDLIEFYEKKSKKLQKEINDYREVGNTRSVKSRENKLFEIGLILDGLNSNIENKKLREKIRDLELRLKIEGINIDE